MIYEFDSVIYPRRIWVTYNATADELNEQFPTGDINGDKFEDIDNCYAITYRTANKDNKGGILIRFADNKEAMKSWNILHESIHAAGMICKYVGIEADWDNDEAFTYLATWIAKCCEEVKSMKAK